MQCANEKRSFIFIILCRASYKALALETHLQSIPSLPIGTARASDSLRETTTFAESTMLPAGRSEATLFAVFVHWLAHPIHSRITTDSLMERIDADYLKVLVRRVLRHPVGIEHDERLDPLADTTFGYGLMITSRFQLVNTVIAWFAISSTLRHLTLAATATDTSAVDDKP